MEKHYLKQLPQAEKALRYLRDPINPKTLEALSDPMLKSLLQEVAFPELLIKDMAIERITRFGRFFLIKGALAKIAKQVAISKEKSTCQWLVDWHQAIRSCTSPLIQLNLTFDDGKWKKLLSNSDSAIKSLNFANCTQQELDLMAGMHMVLASHLVPDFGEYGDDTQSDIITTQLMTTEDTTIRSEWIGTGNGWWWAQARKYYQPPDRTMMLTKAQSSQSPQY
jgi:hypothetical protein